MARRFATLKTSIWENDDFTALPAGPQRLYLFLMSQKDLPLTGVLVRRSKWARSAADYTAEALDADMAVLVATGFVVVDDDTDEVWLRTFMRHDRVLANGKLRTGARNRVDAIHSDRIRGLVVAQLDAADDPLSTGDDPSDTSSDEASPLWTTSHDPTQDDHRECGNRSSDRASDDPPDTPPSSLHHPSTNLPPSQSDSRADETAAGQQVPAHTAGAELDQLVFATWPLVAGHQLDAQRARGQTVRNPAAWLAEAERRARTEHGAHAWRLVTTWQITDPRTLADLLTGRRTLATSHLPRRTPGAA